MYKKFSLALIAFTLYGNAVSAESSQDVGGSNATDSEKVCMITNSSNDAFKESIKNCRRGDIMALGSVTNLGAMKYCDFTKGFIFEGGAIVACVYTGSERPAIKDKPAGK